MAKRKSKAALEAAEEKLSSVDTEVTNEEVNDTIIQSEESVEEVDEIGAEEVQEEVIEEVQEEIIEEAQPEEITPIMEEEKVPEVITPIIEEGKQYVGSLNQKSVIVDGKKYGVTRKQHKQLVANDTSCLKDILK